MSSFYGGGGGGGLSKKDLDAITSKIFKFKIVTSLPIEDISDSTIYLINTGEEEDNFYTEYVYVDNNWEKFGTQKVDLSNYVISQDLTLALETKVDKDGNKVLTDINYSAAEQEKVNAAYEIRHSHDNKTALDSITAQKIQQWNNAEQNVNANWNAESGAAQILNKPDLTVYALADDMTAALGGKVDKETGRSLMTADEHTKLNGIEAGAQVNTVTGVKGNAENNYRTGEINISPANIGLGNVDNTSDADKPISTATETALAGKVDKETNKSLMTADEHTKLSGIETGAQVNTVTGVKGSNEAEYRTGNVSITKGNVGLGNVDNTADADKPISTAAQTALDGKVDKITGKGLSEANFTDTEKTKLAGIATGAEVNVQSDWNQGNDAADDYIKNKPSNLVQDASYVHTDNNFTNAEKAKADGAIQSTEKGTAGGVAELDANGKVPTSQLPAYVDDVLSYNSLNDFPATGEDGKIYIAKDTNLSYRWGSSEYVVISPSLALGSTSSTAYRGDWGAEDRAAIGTLSTLNTTEKSNLVGAINELKTASDAKQGTLDFDSSPTSGSTNPVTSGGVYTALAGKQDTLDFDSAPTEYSDNLVKSGVIYTALVGKADATATQTALASKADATATQAALAGKQNALTAGANITIETVNDALTISATGTTYSAGTGISISNGEISNSAPNVQADWNASGTAAEILNKPTIPNYSNATTSAAGLMSAADKVKLDNNNAGYKVKIWEGSQNLVANSDLSTGYALTNFSALEIRYAMFSNHSTNYTKTIRITRKDTDLAFGEVIPAEKYEYSSGTLSLFICGLTISGSHIYLTYPEGASSFWVFNVYGYK